MLDSHQSQLSENKIRSIKRYNSNDLVTAILFLSPVILFVSILIVFPVIGTGITSLYRDVSYLPKSFLGLDNYKALIFSPDFRASLVFTLIFTLFAVACETVLGLLFALLLNEEFRGRNVLRVVILIPWAIPTIVSAKVWKLIFEYSYGILNVIICGLGLSDEKINWLGTGVTSFWALLLAEVWKTTPFMILILLAGLQAIPRDLTMQARMDGAKPIRRLFTITLPLLRPVLLIALIFRTVDTLRIFDLVFVLTGGGPGGSTKTLSLLGYEFFGNDRFGMGSAISMITFLIALAITLLYLKVGGFAKQLGVKQ